MAGELQLPLVSPDASGIMKVIFGRFSRKSEGEEPEMFPSELVEVSSAARNKLPRALAK